MALSNSKTEHCYKENLITSSTITTRSYYFLFKILKRDPPGF